MEEKKVIEALLTYGFSRKQIKKLIRKERDLNVIMTELTEMQTRFYSEERTKEQLMEVAATVYEEWLIWTYGATDMPYLLKMEVRSLPIGKTGEFEELSKIEKAPFILAAKRITEAMERMK